MDINIILDIDLGFQPVWLPLKNLVLGFEPLSYHKILGFLNMSGLFASGQNQTSTRFPDLTKGLFFFFTINAQLEGNRNISGIMSYSKKRSLRIHDLSNHPRLLFLSICRTVWEGSGPSDHFE
jgi:hypothetical protein